MSSDGRGTSRVLEKALDGGRAHPLCSAGGDEGSVGPLDGGGAEAVGEATGREEGEHNCMRIYIYIYIYI